MFLSDWIRRIRHFPSLFIAYNELIDTEISRILDGREYYWQLREANLQTLIKIADDVQKSLEAQGFKNIKINLIGKSNNLPIVINKLEENK